MRKFRVNHHYKLNEDIVKVIKRDVWKPDTEDKPYIRCRVVHVSEKERSKPFTFDVGFEFDLLSPHSFTLVAPLMLDHKTNVLIRLQGHPVLLKAKNKTRKLLHKESA